MTTPTTADLLKYADLQMAAEAFLVNTAGALVDLKTALVRGNDHASKFTKTQADNFVAHWVVVDQKANTATGFSGTLFKCILDDPATGAKKDELVLSMRSTEFLDDAARDSEATNTLEIRPFGWAFGQISDMKKWYDELNASAAKLQGKSFAVTGYSLGGHLATAFNRLMKDADQANRVTSTYTFNGAGVGELVGSNTLTDAITLFDNARNNGSAGLFTSSVAKQLYASMRVSINGQASSTDMGQALANIAQAQSIAATNNNTQLLKELGLLNDAVKRTKAVLDEANRINAGISSGTDAPNAQPVTAPIIGDVIAGVKLDYQLAVLQASKMTRAYKSGTLDGLDLAYAVDRAPLTVLGLSPIYDVYGNAPPSAVSNSQHHYGQPIPVAIENQPLKRGNYASAVAWNSLLYGETKLLPPNFGVNDFGDTHSLVLLVDSLSVQNTLAQLDPTLTAGTFSQIFVKTSNLAASVDSGQGKAEGDVLEKLVNTLGKFLGVDKAITWQALKGNPNGGTWGATEPKGSYTGSDDLFADLKLIADRITPQLIAGYAHIYWVGGQFDAQKRGKRGKKWRIRGCAGTSRIKNSSQSIVICTGKHCPQRISKC